MFRRRSKDDRQAARDSRRQVRHNRKTRRKVERTNARVQSRTKALSSRTVQVATKPSTRSKLELFEIAGDPDALLAEAERNRQRSASVRLAKPSTRLKLEIAGDAEALQAEAERNRQRERQRIAAKREALRRSTVQPAPPAPPAKDDEVFYADDPSNELLGLSHDERMEAVAPNIPRGPSVASLPIDPRIAALTEDELRYIAEAGADTFGDPSAASPDDLRRSLSAMLSMPDMLPAPMLDALDEVTASASAPAPDGGGITQTQMLVGGGIAASLLLIFLTRS